MEKCPGFGKIKFVWRILDANLNRLAEGLRVLEDISRFALNEKLLAERLKSLRHELIPQDLSLQAKFLSSRDSIGDVGREEGKGVRENIASLATANAKRSQESLRVIEELSRLPNVPLKQGKCSQARFELYELEKEIISQLLRLDRKERVSGLYFILDRQAMDDRDEVEVAQQAIRGGVGLIQLRDKERRGDVIYLARKLRKICAESSVLFLVNDWVDVALAVEADGVHLGQTDFPIQEARKLLPLDKLIGCSVKTLDQAFQAQEEGTDYLSVGSLFPSPTKPEAKVVGPDFLRQVKSEVSLPVVAIGGINLENVAQALSAGADAIAVTSALLQAKDIASTAQSLVQRLRESS